MYRDYIDRILEDPEARGYIIEQLGRDPKSGYVDPLMQIKMISGHPDAHERLRYAYTEALKAVNGNKTRLAELVGIARETLRQHLIKLGIGNYGKAK